jgi:hypothetical protein
MAGLGDLDAEKGFSNELKGFNGGCRGVFRKQRECGPDRRGQIFGV